MTITCVCAWKYDHDYDSTMTTTMVRSISKCPVRCVKYPVRCVKWPVRCVKCMVFVAIVSACCIHAARVCSCRRCACCLMLNAHVPEKTKITMTLDTGREGWGTVQMSTSQSMPPRSMSSKTSNTCKQVCIHMHACAHMLTAKNEDNRRMTGKMCQCPVKCVRMSGKMR